jgi:hypothetical protein
MSRRPAGAAVLGVAFGLAPMAGMTQASGPYRAAAPHRPQLLPGSAGSAAGANTAHWLIGAADSGVARGIARRHRARVILSARRRSVLVLRTPSARAGELAGDLRAAGQLRYSEPDVSLRRSRRPRASASMLPADPLTGHQWWPSAVVHQDMFPPAVTPQTPWLAIIDSQLDTSHPEAAAGNLIAARPGPVTDEHGTAVAATAAAPANGTGIVGLWPGLPTRVYASDLSCGSLSDAINQASLDGAAVISMSFGSELGCYTLYLAVTASSGAAVMVASGGNEFDAGNVPVFPASWPHVMTVAAVDSQLRSALFSNENEGIDLSAPGEALLSAVPAAFDYDGVADGYTLLDGTSYSAPLAAAAAAWAAAARPSLSTTQIIWALTSAARDLGPRGWDQRFGWGLLQVDRDMLEVQPPTDQAEPNDDIQFIDGNVFTRRDAPALSLRGRGRDALIGRLDDWEDPDDVYWLSVPAHSNFDVTLRVTHGDADLFAYRRETPTIAAGSGGFRRRGLIDSSRLSGRRTERLYLRNPGRAGLLALAVRIYHPARSLDAAYTLSARRAG